MNDRARVPLAMVGVLLLVSSAGVAATLGSTEPASQPPTERAIDGAEAETTAVLRDAVANAAGDAARSPVTEPADTAAGRALNESHPFRDALRLRIYLALRERLDSVEVASDDVVATAELPPVDGSESGYRAAIDRVDVATVGEDDAALRVSVRDLSVRATRGDRTVEGTETSPEVVVATPALALHNRTEGFERRANAAPTTPGLGQQLTARLYPIAWARGAAQYGGAPIVTVLGTRHVELATNDALVAEQRAAFGTAAHGTDHALAAAGSTVATKDVLAPADLDGLTDVVLDAADHGGEPTDLPVDSWREEAESEEESTVNVSLAPSADRAYAQTIGVEGADDVADAIERAHTVEATLAVEVDRRETRTTTEGDPEEAWQLRNEHTYTTVDLEPEAAAPLGDPDWTTHRSGTYRATAIERTTRTWDTPDGQVQTETVRRTPSRVRVGVFVRLAPLEPAADPNPFEVLPDATAEAVSAVEPDDGDLRTVARRAARGSSDDRDATATAPVDPATRDAVDEGLQELRTEFRNESLDVPGPAVATGRADPVETLQRGIDDRLSSISETGATTPRDRAIDAARVAFLQALKSDLADRGGAHDDATDGIGEAIEDRVERSRLDGVLPGQTGTDTPERAQLVDPAGDLSLSVETAPTYLPTDRIDGDRIDARCGETFTPLQTRNVNVFTSPHEQVASGIIDRIFGEDRVPLATASQSLNATTSAAAGDGRAALDDEQEALEEDVADAAAYVEDRLVAGFVDEGVPQETAERAVRTDLSTAERGMALTDDRTVDRAVDDICHRRGCDAEERDRLRLAGQVAVEGALADDGARPPRSTTEDATAAAHEYLQDELEDVTSTLAKEADDEARQRALGTKMGAIPAGLPIAPVPGYWIATANVWYVDVAGSYERFAVSADRGRPGDRVTYIRDGGDANVSHDGGRVRLGSAERVSFRVRTAVVVVVPPGGRGVGDTDGVVDDRSVEGPVTDDWSPEHTDRTCASERST